MRARRQRRRGEPLGQIVPRALREEAEQLAHVGQRLFFVFSFEVRDAAGSGVQRRAAEFLRMDVFACGGANHLRSGQEHLSRPADHDRPIR